MAAMSLTAVILASVVVAAIVSSVFSLIGQFFERRSRQNELIFVKALELANAKIKFLKEYSEMTGGKVDIADPVVYAERYFSLLQTLHDKGSLPENWRDTENRIVTEQSTPTGF